ncbi:MULTISPECIES: AbrB/MazE/SpoVT family DNA-binding domain-containing protein [Bacillaceae]|uniref:AbrB/MazE/SpoVT family DNA-binding domain-containing protein n=1 Tax=Bacillaceae TaxID=186817 RepID=UPI000BA53E63|nr:MULTISPECIES: AbrB/MazE/SpoVT family DNA-binding domain-containing protein [Bacillaceae]PAE23652.1 AbrB family transcriptional regulator [Bacillus sp. 7894-2]URM34605.1 AbrB/MazE/SpoVT family DNA-binding domain-containing protein [Cytobacillus firmus]
MKSIGVVRKVDELGRVVLPIELRRVFNIEIKDPLEIFVENDKIILQKYNPGKACAITGEITPENKTFGNGELTLSPRGIEMLLQELNDYQLQR